MRGKVGAELLLLAGAAKMLPKNLNAPSTGAVRAESNLLLALDPFLIAASPPRNVDATCVPPL
jgi:hypothetical protein